MRVSDDDLRRLLTAPAASRAACLPADVLAEAAAGRLEPDVRDAAVEHLGRCRDCAEEVRMLAALEPWAERAAARLPGRARRPRAAPRRRARWPLSLAAAAAVLLAATAVWRQPPGSGALRGRRAPPLVSLLPPAAAQPRAECHLRWSDLGPGVRYAAIVLSKDLRPLATAGGLVRPEYVVPPAALETVPADGEIVWSVEARWPDGRRLASPVFVTRLR